VQFSPDGRAIVYSGRSLAGTQLYYRRLNELTATPLPGTEQGYNATFSPDGEWIAFASSRKTISKVSVHGSGIATIANDIDTEGLSWGRGDVVVIGTATGLFRVSANGGVPVRLTSVDSAKGENSHSMPAVLGDGRTVLFWITTRTAMTGAANASYLGLVRLDDTKVERLEGDAANPIAVVNGTLFFGRSDGTIAAAPFDPPRTKSLSAATPSLQSVMFKVTGGSVASMSTAGDLVYVHGSGDALLALLDSQGKRIGGTAEPRPYSDPRFSPDGRRVAVTIATPTRSDVWLYDVASGVLQRLTSRGSSVRPAWTHDGRRVAYLADTRDAGVSEAWWAPSDGSGPEERLFVKPDNVYLNSITFSPDGRYAVAGTNAATTGRDLYLVDLRGDRKAVPMLQSKAALTAGYEMTVARQDTLFEPMLLSANVNGQFDIAANGTFVVARPASEDPEIIVVTDWLADLRTRLGSGTGKFR
jgi:Tol biopolymer transport system component